MLELNAPLIIVGAGRSGSSLLREMLGAHPEIRMFGEMEFGVTGLWRSCWSVPAVIERRGELIRTSAASHLDPEIDGDEQLLAEEAELTRKERIRIGKLLRSTLGEILELQSLFQKRWGFKEIWIGDRLADDWEPYDAIFPDARYLHIVRNPFDFARSAADWNRLPFNADSLRDSLQLWIQYLNKNRRPFADGRYNLIRYESLLNDPKGTILPVLSGLSLPWSEVCLEPLGTKFVACGNRSMFPPETLEVARQIPELGPLMEEFGYSLPRPDRILPPSAGQSPPAAILPRLVEEKDSCWRIEPPFLAEGDTGWIFQFLDINTPAEWIKQSDDSESPYRSGLELYEDGILLGPAHSRHALIREEGNGRYSHWAAGHMLLFSTSDNSDPNENGRVYTVRG